ncbi:hypothetical protein C8R44DRAFT_872401 [Mycena epipterygia]|nr:hypothetical protein C8R44DRAFT_872401 [Mycena epipterygia]
MDLDDQDDDDNGEGEDLNDSEDLDEGSNTIRYINPHTHQALAILQLEVQAELRDEKATLVVRHEYSLFMQHAISRLNKPRVDELPTRFFVTGQPGIGKCSFFSLHWVFSCIAVGRQELLLLLFSVLSALYGTISILPNSRAAVYYFSSDGVQKHSGMVGPEPWPQTVNAIQKSWVLIDIDDKAEWSCPEIFRQARCVVWTSSSRESRMKHFIKTFGAEKWYMKAWSSKEIAAVTERFDIDHGTILERLDTGGPVARSLFGEWVPELSPEALQDDIKRALSANIFTFKPVHRVFLIQPLVVIDKHTGRARLQRTDCSAQFVSAYIAQKTLDLAQDQLEELQGQLAAALNISTTRSVAGKVVEGLMHRALSRGMKLPDIFGAGSTVARTLELIGKAGSFVCETTTTDIGKQRPLYLRPQSLNFGPVDAILGFFQTSLGDSHSKNYGIILRLVSRLARGAQRVRKLVVEAKRTLDRLQTLDAQKLSEELSIRRSQIAHTRISKLRVVGYVFDVEQGFKRAV